MTTFSYAELRVDDGGHQDLHLAVHDARMEKFDEGEDARSFRPCSSVLITGGAHAYVLRLQCDVPRLAHHFRDQLERMVLTWKPT